MKIEHIHMLGCISHLIMFLSILYINIIKTNNIIINLKNIILYFFLIGHLIISIFLGILDKYKDNRDYFYIGISGHLNLVIHMIMFLSYIYYNKNKISKEQLFFYILFLISQSLMVIRYVYFKIEKGDTANIKASKYKNIKLIPLLILCLFYCIHIFINKEYLIKLACILMSVFYLLLFIVENNEY